MRPNTFGVHFVVRNNRVDKDGCVPIYAKVTINKKVLMLTVNHLIKVKEWDSHKEKPKPNTKSFKIINEAIEAFKSRIYQAYSKVIASNEALTTESLKNAFYGRNKEVEKHTLL